MSQEILDTKCQWTIQDQTHKWTIQDQLLFPICVSIYIYLENQLPLPKGAL